MVLWPRVTNRVPSSIVAVVIVTLIATFLNLSVPTIWGPSPSPPDSEHPRPEPHGGPPLVRTRARPSPSSLPSRACSRPEWPTP